MLPGRKWLSSDRPTVRPSDRPPSARGPMLLLLIRHAHAGDRDPDQWPDDRDRPLTDKGRKTQRDVSRFLRKRDFVPALVLTSPWARAAETAEIVVRELALPNPPVPSLALAESPDLARLAADLGERGAE